MSWPLVFDYAELAELEIFTWRGPREHRISYLIKLSRQCHADVTLMIQLNLSRSIAMDVIARDVQLAS